MVREEAINSMETKVEGRINKIKEIKTTNSQHNRQLNYHNSSSKICTESNQGTTINILINTDYYIHYL